MLARQHPGHIVTNYVTVASVNAAVSKVEKLGGKVCVAKTEVPQMGWFAVCRDTEDNVFAVWEMAMK